MKLAWSYLSLSLFFPKVQLWKKSVSPAVSSKEEDSGMGAGEKCNGCNSPVQCSAVHLKTGFGLRNYMHNVCSFALLTRDLTIWLCANGTSNFCSGERELNLPWIHSNRLSLSLRVTRVQEHFLLLHCKKESNFLNTQMVAPQTLASNFEFFDRKVTM